MSHYTQPTAGIELAFSLLHDALGLSCALPIQGRRQSMPTSTRFSLVHKRDAGADYAYNLSYPVGALVISVAGVQIRVESVTPRMIALQVTHA
ncbi:MAG: hypothetical protein QUS33_02675 [Dehalococcoidia bacterium]|nr:hypothetical protein [Dehalococcoidia bacterium]